MEAPRIRGGGVLGEKVVEDRRVLDVFELPARVSEVNYYSDEVTSICPITGQPDMYEVSITLENSELGLESKSLKLYLHSFRNEGQFCEQFASTIATDVYNAISSEDVVLEREGIVEVSVVVKQKPRGGVSIEATAWRN